MLDLNLIMTIFLFTDRAFELSGWRFRGRLSLGELAGESAVHAGHDRGPVATGVQEPLHDGEAECRPPL